MEDQQAFSRQLANAQNALKSMESAGELVTPSLISEILEDLAASRLCRHDFARIDREELRDELIRRASQSIGRTVTLSDGAGHLPWLTADRRKGWRYWARYRDYMAPKMPAVALEELDRATDIVLGHLEDPQRPGIWDRRGLVVGHVQSGKTGNYTGLICKAADAGYKVIIVLAGLHNNLRAQTQIRLDEGFLGFATLANADDLPAIGVGQIDPTLRPHFATNRSDKGDFNTEQSTRLGISPEERPWLFVIKKNKTVLERINFWIRNRVATHVDPVTGRKLVTDLPLLVIDDEADHGSVDTGEDVVDDNGRPDTEHQPTVLNREIRQILHQFTRSAYVGYTATPFANIFIHDKGRTDEHGPDLFPSSFITNLAAPSNYIGPGRVFGSASAAAEELPLVRLLADEEWQDWLPQRHKSGHMPLWQGEARLPPSLEEAIHAFIFACAVRKLRRQGNRHCSMLIHVSRFTAVQAQVHIQVEACLRGLHQRFSRGIDLPHTEALMRRRYEQDFAPGMERIRESLTPDEEARAPDWAEIRAILPEVIEDIRIREINGSAKDALDYAENEATGLKVIAIGGDKLARGLTLEGLVTSYFLRTARMYDTLMQMGRWFGYRDGYLDTCRLYTTSEMTEWFGHIADAAEELRQEFDNMEATGGTPKDFGLRVKSHSTLTITSRAKMRSAKPVSITYAGDLLQTTTFPVAREGLAQNFAAGETMLEALGQGQPLSAQPMAMGRAWNGWYWNGVAAQDVTRFLRAYRAPGSSLRVNGPLLAEFIDGMVQDGELTEWTVALVGKTETDGPPVAIAGHEINSIKRRATSSEGGRHAIKVLTSPRDETIGLSEAEWQAALALTHRTWQADKERNSGSEPPEVPRGSAVREVLGKGWDPTGLAARPQRGLLLLYLLDPTSSGFVGAGSDDRVLGWAVSLPGSSSSRKVNTASTYMGNSVEWEALNGWVD